ncbi:patatin-like phospholipase family protein [Slackia piriformis]|uniref:patatin-like phospholipase family protein n=1 Tax=Slackia piriformis TaxID=626934 RepID=UPI0039F5596C
MKQSYYTSPAAQRTPAYEGSPVLDVNLILEGGAMRGQFTAGVLDYFMDNGLWCKNVVGTSAGALNGYNYIAGELGRTCYLNTKYCGDPRYLSMRNFALTGSAIRRDFMFDEIPNKLEPFNFDAFRNSPMRLTTVASNLETGEADYHVMKDAHDERDLLYLQASASMPLVSKIIEVDGKKLLDGGPCDSVPLLHCILDGVGDKHIVVLTQDATYIKSPNKTMPLVHRVYSDYPLFAERMEHRHFEYNRTYRWVRKLHNEGKVFMIQPPEPVTISNMEKDPEKLLALYEQGYAEAARQWSALQAYLEQ